MLERDHVLATLARLRERDPARGVFGAAVHDYALAAPLAVARVEAIEAALGVALPADYRAFVTTVASAGAGPGYGLVSPDHASQIDDAVLLADHGCTYLSLLVVRGDDAGQVIADVKSGGLGVRRTHTSFTAWYADWLAALEHEPTLDACPAPGSVCSTPDALGNYLAQFEEQEGVPAGALDEHVVRDALQAIGPGGIANSTEADRFFDDGPVRLCMCCVRMIDRFVARGMMRWDQFVTGQAPRPERADDGRDEPGGDAGDASGEEAGA